MAATPEALARIAARIREHVQALERVAEALDDSLQRWSAEPQDVVIIHWVGGRVHDFYTGLEKVFSDVSPELNGLDRPGVTWHRDLLHAMTLDLPAFRPPVIRAELEPDLLELLKFRHLYRNLYSFQLQWQRVRELATSTLDLWPRVESDLTEFSKTLERLARAD